MADRADYLARTLMNRLARLRAHAAEEGRGEPRRDERLAVIEKILVVELGIVDGATISLIESAVPHVGVDERATDRDVAGFAAFLRRRLATPLTET